jgi:hypothetical protein
VGRGMIDGVAWLLALTFHKWIIVCLVCYVFGGLMMSKMIDRLGKETDSLIMARRKVIFIIIYLMFAIGTFGLLMEIGAFEALLKTYQNALEIAKDTHDRLIG